MQHRAAQAHVSEQALFFVEVGTDLGSGFNNKRLNPRTVLETGVLIRFEHLGKMVLTRRDPIRTYRRFWH